MHVLVIAPHPDDEAIGCGGALCLHKQAGDRLSAVFLSSGELGLKNLPREEAWRTREKEARKSCSILGMQAIDFFRGPDWTLSEAAGEIAPRLASILKADPPDMIYLPHPLDWHPDHRATLPLLQRAMAEAKVPAVEARGYEVWTPLSHHDFAQDISEVMQQKLRALRAHRSQLREFDYVRAVKGLNSYRGELTSRCQYAEVFQRLDASP
jgi:LmbE family N-acetylglucosaminyl deacetylase